MTDGGQVVTSSNAVTAYGQTVAVGGGTASPYGFKGSAGYRSDGDSPAGGSNYLKVGARYYDPEWGRFITRDTDLSQKPYQYCDGDPVNFSDPSGGTKKTTKTVTTVIPNSDGSVTTTVSHTYDDGSSDSNTTTTAPGSGSGTGEGTPSGGTPPGGTGTGAPGGTGAGAPGGTGTGAPGGTGAGGSASKGAPNKGTPNTINELQGIANFVAQAFTFWNLFHRR